MSANPFDILDTVCDRESFVAFVKALGKDFADQIEKEQVNPSPLYGPGANGWENGRIDTFLDAASAWADAVSDRLGAFEKRDNPWWICAHILYMGKIYE